MRRSLDAGPRTSWIIFFHICIVWPSLKGFPKNQTREARLTLSNTSTGNKNHNQFEVGGNLLPWPNGLSTWSTTETKSQEEIISPKFQPQEFVTTKHLACKCTCHHSSNYFLTRSFSSVLVDCLQSGCQTVEPGKKQHTTKIKGNATKPQSCQIELLRPVHILLPQHRGVNHDNSKLQGFPLV